MIIHNEVKNNIRDVIANFLCETYWITEYETEPENFLPDADDLISLLEEAGVCIGNSCAYL